MKTELYKKANRIISQISYLQNVRDLLKYRPEEIVFHWRGKQHILPISKEYPEEKYGEKVYAEICDKLVEYILEQIEEKIQSLRTEFENL